MGLMIVPREEWGSWAPWGRTPQPPPVDTVLCSYTETDACRTIAQCREFMQLIQRRHIRLDKLQDVPYNFVIGGDGKVYEGRGWLLRPELGEREEEYKGKLIYVGICGREGDGDPLLLTALNELIIFGTTYRLITENVKKAHIPCFILKAETSPDSTSTTDTNSPGTQAAYDLAEKFLSGDSSGTHVAYDLAAKFLSGAINRPETGPNKGS